MTVPGWQFTLCKGLRNVDMISKHVELDGKTENSVETASSRHGAKSVIVIADAVSDYADAVSVSCVDLAQQVGLCNCRIHPLSF